MSKQIISSPSNYQKKIDFLIGKEFQKMKMPSAFSLETESMIHVAFVFKHGSIIITGYATSDKRIVAYDTGLLNSIDDTEFELLVNIFLDNHE